MSEREATSDDEATSNDGVASNDGAADPRLHEVDGDTGLPGELIGGDHNQPGSQEPPAGVEATGTAISDAKGTTSTSDEDELD